mgnify:CR=1 FL=1
MRLETAPDSRGWGLDPHKSKMMELREENVSTSNQCRQ